MIRLLLGAVVALAVTVGCAANNYAELEAARQAGRADALAEQLRAARELERQQQPSATSEAPASRSRDAGRSAPATTVAPADVEAELDATYAAVMEAEDEYQRAGCYDLRLTSGRWVSTCAALEVDLSRAWADAYVLFGVAAVISDCHDFARWLSSAAATYRADAADLELALALDHNLAAQSAALESYISRASPDSDEFDRLSTSCFGDLSDTPSA